MLTAKAKIRRIKFWWHLLGAYISRYKLRVTLAFLTIALASLATTRLWPYATRSNIIATGFVGSYSIENIPTEVLSLAANSLIASDNSGRPIPSLASNWTVSADGKTYMVYLRDNLRWHDSTPVDAGSVSIAISNVQINAFNNKTIEFKLPNPIASFPQTLNKPIFKANTFYGTGEFRIIKIDQVENIVKRIVLHSPDSQLPKVEIKFYPTEEQLIEAIKIGEVKSATVISSADFSNWHNLTVAKKLENSQIATIFLNNDDPLLSSKEVRQALTYAIDRSAFDGEIANSPISPTSWAYNDTLKKHEYNLTRAKELIAKSQAKDLKITLSTTPEFRHVAQKVKENWQGLGFSVEIKEEKTLPKNFQALLAIDKIAPDPDQYALWHSTQKETNITHYKNVKIDKLLEDARATTDEKARMQLYADFQKFLVEDSPAIFLYHPNKYKVTYKNIQDLLSKLPSQ